MAMASTAASALQAAGIVGTWDTDVPAGRSVLDAGAAKLLAGDVGLAGAPLALEVALGRIHPGDRDRVFGAIGQVRRTGGPVALQFRVLSGTGGIRWILNRGHLAPDARGALHGCGAYIDVTDLHAGPGLPGFGGDPVPTDHRAAQLDAAAEHAIRAHAALERHGDVDLRLMSDILLLGIGRALARRGPWGA
jgi:hypothetical protein